MHRFTRCSFFAGLAVVVATTGVHAQAWNSRNVSYNVIDLGLVDAYPAQPSTDTFAIALNDENYVLEQVNYTSSDTPSLAQVYTKIGQPLLPPQPLNLQSAIGLNDNGLYFGATGVGSNPLSLAVQFPGGIVKTLSSMVPGSESFPTGYGINNLNELLVADSNTQVYLCKPSGRYAYSKEEFPRPCVATTAAMNNLGHVVITTQPAGQKTPTIYFWSGSQVEELPLPANSYYAESIGINDNDVIVGSQGGTSAGVIIWRRTGYGSWSYEQLSGPTGTVFGLYPSGITNAGVMYGGMGISGGQAAFIANVNVPSSQVVFQNVNLLAGPANTFPILAIKSINSSGTMLALSGNYGQRPHNLLIETSSSRNGITLARE